MTTPLGSGGELRANRPALELEFRCMQLDHDFLLECYDASGRRLAAFRPDLDWEPVSELLKFEALGRPDFRDEDFASELVLEPVWEPRVGPPYARAIRAWLPRAEDRKPLSCELALPWFARYARGAAVDLIERELLKPGDEYRYLLRAEAAADREERSVAGRFAADVRSIVPRRHPGKIAERLACAVPLGPQSDVDHHVFIPQAVMAQAKAMAEESPEVEIGAFLAGHLYQDAVTGLFLEITDLMPAEHTRGEAHKLTFTANTWAAANRSLQAMNPEPRLLGWSHTHPGIGSCRAECSAEQRQQCPLQREFFSADDRLVHRASFPAAYSVALVATPTEVGISFALYGWRNADIVVRGFHLLDPSGPEGLPTVDDSASYASEETEQHYVTNCPSTT